MRFDQQIFEGQLHPAEREMLHQIASLGQTKTAFEVGTWKGGGSTFFTSRAFKDKQDGKLYTCEANQEFYQIAHDLYHKRLTDHLPHLELMFGMSHTVFPPILKQLGEGGGKVDMVFLDGCDDPDATVADFDMFYPYLSDHAFVACHDWKIEKASKLKEHPVLRNNFREFLILTDTVTGMGIFQHRKGIGA